MNFKIFFYISIPLLVLFLIMCNSSSKASSKVNANRTTYYLNAQNGNDSNDGLSATKAFKSLQKINSLKLKAGDSILLKGQQVFSGTCNITREIVGTEEQPIVFATYDEGKAIIDAKDSLAFHIVNASFVHLKNIHAKGSGRKNGNRTNGIHFQNCTQIVIDNIETEGFIKSGLSIRDGKDIRITNVYAHDNGSCGIEVSSGVWSKNEAEVKSVHNLYIGYCVAENNPGNPTVFDNHSGNGILVGGVSNGIIEYCEAMNNGWDMPREGNGPVGIWTYASDNITIQYCYAHHNKTSEKGKDGGGFDFDGGVTNSVLQYNLSAYNEGAGYGMFQYDGALPWHNNVVRYNISYHDGIKNGQCGIFMWRDERGLDMKNLHAYNNTIVNKYGHGVNFLPGDYPNFVFENNVFYLTDKATEFIAGDYKTATFNNNLYWSDDNTNTQSTTLAKIDKSKLLAHPNLRLPLEGKIKVNDIRSINSIPYFKFNTNGLSPCIGNGTIIKNQGEHNYWGSPLKTNTKPNIGAY